MARAYDPGGHIRLNIAIIGTSTYGPHPGGDLQIFDCFPGPVLTPRSVQTVFQFRIPQFLAVKLF